MEYSAILTSHLGNNPCLSVKFMAISQLSGIFADLRSLSKVIKSLSYSQISAKSLSQSLRYPCPAERERSSFSLTVPFRWKRVTKTMGTKLAEPRYALKRVRAHSPIVIMATDRKEITAPRVQRRNWKSRWDKYTKRKKDKTSNKNEKKKIPPWSVLSLRYLI